MAAKCNSRSNKRKIILQPRQTQREKLFHCLTQTAHSLQESEMHFVQKNHLFVKKPKIGFGKVKGHLGCFYPKDNQFTYWETFRDSWGGQSFQQSTRI